MEEIGEAAPDPAPATSNQHDPDVVNSLSPLARMASIVTLGFSCHYKKVKEQMRLLECSFSTPCRFTKIDSHSEGGPHGNAVWRCISWKEGNTGCSAVVSHDFLISVVVGLQFQQTFAQS